MAALLVAGCSGSSGPGLGAGSASAGLETGSVPPSVTAPPGRQAVVVRPDSGLRSGQEVDVAGAGFTAGESLVVTLCRDLGGATGAGDCDLGRSRSVTVRPDGRVTAELTVDRGPFGADRVVCDLRVTCIVSVTEASLQPDEEAHAVVTFALP